MNLNIELLPESDKVSITIDDETVVSAQRYNGVIKYKGFNHITDDPTCDALKKISSVLLDLCTD